MTKPSFKKADDFIAHNSRDLQTIFTRINLLEQLNEKIRAYFNPEIAKYCQVVNLAGSKLTLIAANGSVATQIRFQTHDLLKKFNQDPVLKRVLFLECKVRPTQSQVSTRLTDNPGKSMPLLSAETGEMVCAMAETIEDIELRKVMVRIGKRVKTSSI